MDRGLFNWAAMVVLHRFSIATNRPSSWVAYHRPFQAIVDMKLKQSKVAFKLGGAYRLVEVQDPSYWWYSTCETRVARHGGSLKHSARAVQLFGRLAVLETHALRS